MTKEEWKQTTGREPEHLYTLRCKGRNEPQYWDLKTFEDLKTAKSYKAHCKKVDASYHQTGAWNYLIEDENRVVCG